MIGWWVHSKQSPFVQRVMTWGAQNLAPKWHSNSSYMYFYSKDTDSLDVWKMNRTIECNKVLTHTQVSFWDIHVWEYTIMCRWIIEMKEPISPTCWLSLKMIYILTGCRLVDKDCIDVHVCNSIFIKVRVSTILHRPLQLHNTCSGISWPPKWCQIMDWCSSFYKGTLLNSKSIVMGRR